MFRHFTDMLGQYREDGETDDNDAIYLHGAGTGQSIVLRRLVVANCEDDGIDTLDADLLVEHCLIRDLTDTMRALNEKGRLPKECGKLCRASGYVADELAMLRRDAMTADADGGGEA